MSDSTTVTNAEEGDERYVHVEDPRDAALEAADALVKAADGLLDSLDNLIISARSGKSELWRRRVALHEQVAAYRKARGGRPAHEGGQG